LVVEFFQIIRIAGNSFLPISNYFKRAWIVFFIFRG
jgi:hypothetical protein